MPTLLTPPPTSVVPDLTTADLTLIMSSAGKDSLGMLDLLAEHARDAGVLDRVTVVHNDLGTTDSGMPVEWPGTRELAAEQAAFYGFRFEVTRRDLGGLFQQIRAHGNFPSSNARFCTSDQKTSQAMKLVTRLVAETGITDRPVRVFYCVGLRAEESPSRASKPALAVDRRASSGRRVVTRSHPILQWTEAQVWARIEESGAPSHPAYSQGMGRLSCSFCPLAGKEDLIRAAQLRPDLAAEYLALEIELGVPFRRNFPMSQIIAEAERRTATALASVPAASGAAQ